MRQDSQCTILAAARDMRTSDELLIDLAYICFDKSPCRWNGKATYIEGGNLQKVADICYGFGADHIIVDVETSGNPEILKKAYQALRAELAICGCPFTFLARKRWLAYLPKGVPSEAIGKHHTAEALLYAAIVSPLHIERNALTREVALAELYELYHYDHAEGRAIL